MSDLPINRNNPFLASIKERYTLSRPGSQKSTHHVILDLANSGISYEVGDSIGVYPQHDPQIVLRTLRAMKASGNEVVCFKEENLTLVDFLTSRGNLTEISPKLLKEVCVRQTNQDKKQHLEALLNPDNRDAFKQYAGMREIWDFLLEHEEVFFTHQEFVDLMMPLLPRFYSIASSAKSVGPEVHLTVAHVKYEANGYPRHGICTHYICHMAPLNQPAVPIFIQPAHTFRLPSDNSTPIIMIGPGTGVAPFRAFMQERISTGATGKHWLFFGERNREYDFLYEDFWRELVKDDKLRVDVAFSRDQEHKIYVQNMMDEHGSEFYRWLEEGAYLFVCGDAKRMAKDVESMLHQIIRKHGNKDEAEAKLYVKKLRADKRYLRDVY